MNKILIVQFALGPTHKARLLKNLQSCKAYDYFDVFILTDSVEYFSSINKSNIIIKDLDLMRKDYPWSIELEKIPPKTDDEAEYAKYFIENNVKIPTLLRRFVFLWDKVENYDGFIFMDCDILPNLNDNTYPLLEEYFCTPFKDHPVFPTGEKLEDKIIVMPGGSSYDDIHHGYLKDFAISINEKYKITNKKIEHNFIVTDGNFRTIKFPKKEMIKPFFELMNNIIYDILFVNKESYFVLGTHSMWNLHSEYILSIMFNLLDARAFPMTSSAGIRNGFFNIDCYPEDRFWNWGMDMESSIIGKNDFINKNYDKLKKFYENRAQEFPY
jgi:hypothetical protein